MIELINKKFRFSGTVQDTQRPTRPRPTSSSKKNFSPIEKFVKKIHSYLSEAALPEHFQEREILQAEPPLVARVRH
jgi:hypothetical protein